MPTASPETSSLDCHRLLVFAKNSLPMRWHSYSRSSNPETRERPFVSIKQHGSIASNNFSLLAIRYPLSLFYENAIDSIPFTLEIVNARQWKRPMKRAKQRDFSIRQYDFDVVRSWLLDREQRRFDRKQSGPTGSSDRLTLRRQTSKRR